MARSGSGISAIFASTSLSPSALSRARARGRLQLPGALPHRVSFLFREGRLALRGALLAAFGAGLFAGFLAAIRSLLRIRSGRRLMLGSRGRATVTVVFALHCRTDVWSVAS